MAIVYEHRRKDTGEIFYIGIGKDKYRVSKKTNRNSHWHNIVNKYGYTKKIIFSELSWGEAIEKEIELIKKYGRRDIGTGCLVNMTKGGEGRASRDVSYPDYYSKEELRDLILPILPRS
jgi:hypothetical protein